eukprot:3909703-Amphidinium_carterae.2
MHCVIHVVIIVPFYVVSFFTFSSSLTVSCSTPVSSIALVPSSLQLLLEVIVELLSSLSLSLNWSNFACEDCLMVSFDCGNALLSQSVVHFPKRSVPGSPHCRLSMSWLARYSTFQESAKPRPTCPSVRRIKAPHNINTFRAVNPNVLDDQCKLDRHGLGLNTYAHRGNNIRFWLWLSHIAFEMLVPLAQHTLTPMYG